MTVDPARRPASMRRHPSKVSGPASPGGPFRRAMAHRDLRLLVASLVFGEIRHLMSVVALSVYVFQQTGSPAWVSAVVIARGIPVALFSALAGAVVDRREHRQLMLESTYLSAGIMVLLAVVMARSAPTWTLIPLVAAGSLVSTPLTPAVLAYLPDLVPEDDLVAANTAREASRKLGQIIGPAGAGLIIAVSSATVAVVVSVAAALLAALFLTAIRTRSRSHATRGAGTSSGQFEDLRRGIVALRERPGAVLLLALLAAYYFMLGLEHVLYTLTADRVLGLGANGLGFLFAAIGVGGVTLAASTNRLAARKNLGGLLSASLVTTGLAFLALGWATKPVAAYLLLFLIGAGGITFNVLTTTTLQRVLARGVLGRITGLRVTITFAATLLGSLLAPLSVAVLGLRLTFVATGLVLVLPAVGALPRLRVLGEAAEKRRLELAPRVSLLERPQLFEGAARPTLESLARDLVREEVPAGRVVIQQGDPAEELYLVDVGTFVVQTRAGHEAEEHEVAVLGPGDYFGEIGLLHEQPRNATVRAVGDGVVYRLSKAQFLSALVGGMDISASARATIAERMARAGR
jgi:predicted MFS family arabinose efflux permease